MRREKGKQRIYRMEVSNSEFRELIKYLRDVKHSYKRSRKGGINVEGMRIFSPDCERILASS